MRFKRIYLEITNKCNLSCSFCTPVLREKKSMSVEEFKYIINQIKPFTKYIYLHIKGEPLIHPNLSEFLDICNVHGIKVNITTNATLLEQNAKMLLEKPALRQLNISLHAHTSDNKYINAIFDYADKANEIEGKFVVLRFWNLDKNSNLDENSRLLIQEIEQKYGFENRLLEMIGNRPSIQLMEKVFFSLEKEFVWPSLSNEFVSDEGFCHGLKDMVGILVDGEVVPCCLDANAEASLGNVFKESFENIINSKRTLKILNFFNARKVVEPLCQRCSFRTKFK
jgi:radical SAM protein with 4Fe4S-binding SPASM domain